MYKLTSIYIWSYVIPYRFLHPDSAYVWICTYMVWSPHAPSWCVFTEQRTSRPLRVPFPARIEGPFSLPHTLIMVTLPTDPGLEPQETRACTLFRIHRAVPTSSMADRESVRSPWAVQTAGGDRLVGTWPLCELSGRWKHTRGMFKPQTEKTRPSIWNSTSPCSIPFNLLKCLKVIVLIKSSV